MKDKFISTFENYTGEPESNADKISELTNQMLDDAIPHIRKSIERAIISGAIDVDGWDENHNKMLIPKAILVASLENEADQYKADGTSFERQVKKDIRNIKLFL